MLWAIGHLRLDFEPGDGPIGEGHPGPGFGRLRLADEDQAAFDGRAELITNRPLDFSSTTDSAYVKTAVLEPLTLEGQFGTWLMDKLRASITSQPAHPSRQPSTVKDIAEALFPAYQVEDGQIHLGGCQLDDYPFLRLSFLATDENPALIHHLFVAPDGSSVPDKMVHDLGLLEVSFYGELPPRIDDSTLSTLETSGRRIAAKGASQRNPSAVTICPIASTLIWVKHARGHLQFTIGSVTENLEFSGWATLLTPQPFLCTRSGTNTFHLAATDDGLIDAWEQIATCERSGRTVLKQDLVECSVTGQHVLEEFTEICPVSGKPALSDEFCICPNCRQQISKESAGQTQCAACEQLLRIQHDDSRLLWILGEHSGLERWRRWQLAETERVYIVQARRMLRRLLVVVDKETLAIHHLATTSLFSSHWSPVTEGQRREILE
jgi:hypothetical protein